MHEVHLADSLRRISEKACKAEGESMSDKESQQWMRDAAKEIMQLWYDRVSLFRDDKLAAIIASHCPEKEQTPANEQQELGIYEQHMADMIAQWEFKPLSHEDRVWINGYRQGYLAHLTKSKSEVKSGKYPIARPAPNKEIETFHTATASPAEDF